MKRLFLLIVLSSCSTLSSVTPADRAAAYEKEAFAMRTACKSYRFDRQAELVPEVSAMEKACP